MMRFSARPTIPSGRVHSCGHAACSLSGGFDVWDKDS